MFTFFRKEAHYSKGGMVMLRDLICSAQAGDKKAMMELIDKFSPLFKKYARKLDYEDAYEDIILFHMEMIRYANALFGIKKNGWTGRTYKKAATEQRKDGSYYIEGNTLWRAYDSWEQSIRDHDDYIATRSTDGGRTLRYSKVVGCDDHVLACQYLQECGYATSLTYRESLVRDYIEKYHLLRFDSCSSSDPYKN